MSVADRAGTDIATVLGVGENVSEEPYPRTMSWMLEIGAIARVLVASWIQWVFHSVKAFSEFGVGEDFTGFAERPSWLRCRRCRVREFGLFPAGVEALLEDEEEKRRRTPVKTFAPSTVCRIASRRGHRARIQGRP